MAVTGKGYQKPKKRRQRSKQGPPSIVDLANFLNLDLAKSDIQNRWYKFHHWRLGVPPNATASDRSRYAKLKLLVSVLQESDVNPAQPQLIANLEVLQDEVKSFLKPLLGSSLSVKEQQRLDYETRRGMESLVARLNRCRFSPQWALYQEGVLNDDRKQHHRWYCTYSPERPNDVTRIDGEILAQQKVLRRGNYRYVVMEMRPRTRSIADRLYWYVGQTLMDASISRLKTCVECQRYFSAYDSKQVVCGQRECRDQHNRRGAANRVKRLRARKKRNLS
jgi:hypothetical protein